MKLITITTFDNMPTAYIVKGRLETEGIPCWLKDENLGQMDWLYSRAGQAGCGDCQDRECSLE